MQLHVFLAFLLISVTNLIFLIARNKKEHANTDIIPLVKNKYKMKLYNLKLPWGKIGTLYVNPKAIY